MHPYLSVVIPVYDEQKALPELYHRLIAALDSSEISGYEIIFVNDGSADSSMEIILRLRRSDERVKAIELSRNFGHQTALTAGIDNACGDAVILMDADLQDSPEIIPELVRKWREGYEVVYVIRTRRRENWAKQLAFKFFYRLLRRLSSIKMPPDAGIFSLISREVADVLKAMPERNRYISGLRWWAGFKQVGVFCQRNRRFADKPRQTIKRLITLALDAIFSFSYFPLRLSTFVGVFVAFFSFAAGLVAVYLRLSKILIIPLGWTSTIVVISFLSGVILLMLGIVGEYIARIYDEIKGRPQYIVRQKIGFKN